jgi:hypothetical protein
MNTLEALQSFLSDCSAKPELVRHVGPTRRAAAIMYRRCQHLFPHLQPPELHAFITAYAASCLMVVECLVNPRSISAPVSLNPFYLRLHWRRARDGTFKTIQNMSWVFSFAYRTKNEGQTALAPLLIGMQFEKLLYQSEAKTEQTGFAVTIGRTICHSAMCLALDAREIFYSSDKSDHETLLLVEELNREVFSV